MNVLVLLCAIMAQAGPASDIPARSVMPVVEVEFANLNLFDPLPAYTQRMSNETYAKWAKAQNAMAYRKSRQEADEWNARNPALDYVVQYNDYDAVTVDADQPLGGARVGRAVGTGYRGRTAQRTFRNDGWAGPPVVILNPYFRK